jgi:alcohol dehydrogenase (cytochrome c)
MQANPKHLQWFFLVNLLIWQNFSFAQTSSNTAADVLNRLTPVTDALLANPPAEDWLIWRGGYGSLGYSALDQINRQNVAQLSLAWRTPLEAGSNMATPLVHDGVMFLLSTADTMLALDARSGATLWTYKHPLTTPANAKMGIALAGNKVLIPTSDMHVLALDNKTGALLWDHAITDRSTGRIPLSLRGAPLIAGGKLIQGINATMAPGGGFIVALDLETGDESWRFYTVARPDAPGGNTWNDLALEQRSGGSVWVAGSYDPELDLVYFGAAPTYDTAPLMHSLNKAGVSNDALYTNTTLALRPATGELVWHYQHIANDQWDLDWAYERQVLEMPINGVTRKVVLTAGKMALYDVLDAASGDYLFSADMGIQNMITAVDPVTGAKILHPNAIPNAETTHLLCPMALGGRNWPAASINPQSRVLYVPLSEVCFNGGRAGSGSRALLSSGVVMDPAPMPDSDGNFGRVQAYNLNTREPLWNFREMVMSTSAILATAGNIVFVGALDKSFKAFDDSSGEVLWQTDVGDIPASFPITYSVAGKQYVAVVVGQASLHATTFIGMLNGFIEAEANPLRNMTRSGAAIMVYALDQ